MVCCFGRRLFQWMVFGGMIEVVEGVRKGGWQQFQVVCV